MENWTQRDKSESTSSFTHINVYGEYCNIQIIVNYIFNISCYED